MKDSIIEYWDRSIDLERELELIDRSDYTTADTGLNTDYPGHDTLSGHLWDAINSIWESEPTELYYNRYNIAYLCYYIGLRRRYPEIDENILARMLEPDVSINTKRELLSLGYSPREVLELLEQVRTYWGGRFIGNGFREMVNGL